MSVVNVSKETVDDWHAGSGTVGTTEALISSINWPVAKYVIVRANAANSGVIMVNRPGDAANGFILAAGEQTPPIPIDNTFKVRVVGSAIDQDYSWMAV